jgi:hypothetical protein
MLRSILCVSCLLVGIPVATAQVVISQRTQVIGSQRITDIFVREVLPLPRQGGAEAKGQGETSLVTLMAKDWKSGVQFKDDNGSVWRLLYGPTLLNNPPQLNGALTRAGDGRVLFLTSGGTLFIRVEK